MKKSKLLIPALSIASVGAIVAPIVTSCDSNSKTVVTLYDQGYGSYTFLSIDATHPSQGYTIKANKPVKYTGVTQFEGAKTLVIATASGTAASVYIEPTKVTVNGVECDSPMSYTTAWAVHIPASVTTTNLTIEVTYKEGASHCSTVVQVLDVL